MSDIKKTILAIGVILAVIIGLPIFWGSWYTIDQGHVGVVKTWGKVVDVSSPGLNFKIPFAQGVDEVDIRTRKAHSPAEAGSKDMQRISTEVSVNYHIDQTQVKQIYSTVGIDNLEDKIVDPRIQEEVKAVVAKYSADQLLQLRENVKREIEQNLTRSLKQYNIVLEGVQITNFKFSDQYNSSIEAKQIAEQSAQKAQNDLTRIKVEAEQKIAQAKAEAEAIRIQAEAIKANGGKEYVQKIAIEKWNGELPTYMGGNGPLPFLTVK